MSFWADMFGAAATGAIHTAAGRLAGNPGVRKVEALCATLGWSIDGREGETALALNFGNPAGGVRQVVVVLDGVGGMAVLSCHSRARLRPLNAPPQLAYYLLAQSAKAFFHAWNVHESDDGTVSFYASYAALLDGMEANVFRLICENMAKDVNGLDAKLRQGGLL